MDEALTLIEEEGRWHARDVSYIEGPWKRLREQLPTFKKEKYRAGPDLPENPYMRSVVRLPRTQLEQPIPVGVVSNTYSLAQHCDVADKCLEGICDSGIEVSDLRFEVGLTELGEWMNLRIYFPSSFDFAPKDKENLGLRLECFNSVDGTSRLVVLLSWLRLVCSNGMVIRETMAELKAVHNKSLDLDVIPKRVRKGMDLVEEDRRRLATWDNTLVHPGQIRHFADKILPLSWRKKAGCRVFHICDSGFDVEYQDPFEKGDPTTKAVKRTQAVPGAPVPAKTLYDVSQALSWIATTRSDSEERVQWQSQIPDLIDKLAGVSAQA